MNSFYPADFNAGLVLLLPEIFLGTAACLILMLDLFVSQANCLMPEPLTPQSSHDKLTPPD